MQEQGALPSQGRRATEGQVPLPEEEQEPTVTPATPRVERGEYVSEEEPLPAPPNERAGASSSEEENSAAEKSCLCEELVEQTALPPIHEHRGQQAVLPEASGCTPYVTGGAAAGEPTNLAATQSAPSLSALETAVLTGSLRATAYQSTTGPPPVSFFLPPCLEPSCQQLLLQEQQWLRQQHPRLLYARSGDTTPQAHTWRCRRCLSSSSVHDAAASAAAAANSGAVLTSCCSSTGLGHNLQQQQQWVRHCFAYATTSSVSEAATGAADGAHRRKLPQVAAAAVESTLSSGCFAVAQRSHGGHQLLQHNQQPSGEAVGGVDQSQSSLPSDGVQSVCCAASQSPAVSKSGLPSHVGAAIEKTAGKKIRENHTPVDTIAVESGAAITTAETASSTAKSTARISEIALQQQGFVASVRGTQKREVPAAPIGVPQQTGSAAAAKSEAPETAAATACGTAVSDNNAAVAQLVSEEGCKAEIAVRDADVGDFGLSMPAEKKAGDEGGTPSMAPYSDALSQSAVTEASPKARLFASSLDTGLLRKRAAVACGEAVGAVAGETLAGLADTDHATVVAADTTETAVAFSGKSPAAAVAASIFSEEASGVAAAATAALAPSFEVAVGALKPHVLIIITGGTICMDYGGQQCSLRPQRLAQRLQQLPELRDASLPNFDVLEWETLVDSSEIRVAHWQRLARQIQQFYDAYDGFVVLHGTDTLAYTASALSFMLENSAKPVILTGSMLPMQAIHGSVCSCAWFASVSAPAYVRLWHQRVFLSDGVQELGSRLCAAVSLPELVRTACLCCVYMSSIMLLSNTVSTPAVSASFAVVAAAATPSAAVHIATDAKRNLVASMLIAGCSELREVAVVFGAHVLRGCRVTKFDCAGFDAFASPNCPPLGLVGVDVVINEEALLLRQASSCSAAALVAAAGVSPALQSASSACSAVPSCLPLASGRRARSEAAGSAVHAKTPLEQAGAYGNSTPAADGGDPLEEGLRVFHSMAENIVALPLTPYLSMEVLQSLFALKTGAKTEKKHCRSSAVAGAAESQQGKQQPQWNAASLKREIEDAAALEGETNNEQRKIWHGDGGKHSPPLSVILMLYGSGTAPASSELLHTLRNGIENGVNVVVLSQCRRGCANLLAYENGVHLHNLGVISGKDSTLEACVAKLSYLTGKGFTGKRLKELMEADLRGEITESLNKVGVGSSTSRAANATVTHRAASFPVNEQTSFRLQSGAGIRSTKEGFPSCDRYSVPGNIGDNVLSGRSNSDILDRGSNSNVGSPRHTRRALS